MLLFDVFWRVFGGVISCVLLAVPTSADMLLFPTCETFTYLFANGAVGCPIWAAGTNGGVPW